MATILAKRGGRQRTRDEVKVDEEMDAESRGELLPGRRLSMMTFCECVSRSGRVTHVTVRVCLSASLLVSTIFDPQGTKYRNRIGTQGEQEIVDSCGIYLRYNKPKLLCSDLLIGQLAKKERRPYVLAQASSMAPLIIWGNSEGSRKKTTPDRHVIVGTSPPLLGRRKCWKKHGRECFG